VSEERGNLKFAVEFLAATWRARVTNTRAVSSVILTFAIAIGMGAALAVADEATRISVTLKDHKFSPAEPTAPAGKPIVIDVSNLDSTPSEFESKTLRVEKVVPGGGKIAVQIRPLGPGRYRFFDDYHEDTTEGFLIVK
jgi:Cupredoxin-like domain